MTRAELIARIEAGETGPDIDFRIDDVAHPQGYIALNRKLSSCTPCYTTSIDDAVTLLAGCGWYVAESGKASVWIGPNGPRYEARIRANPAAALVAAWLKATA